MEQINNSNRRESIATTQFTARQEGKNKYIEGYFIVFNQYTKLWNGFYEQISPEAVQDMSDVKALYNHNHDLILGTTKSKTLRLKKDSYGIKGSILINEGDTDALNAYERIKRGDVKGCSFGFELLKEDIKQDPNGDMRSTITSMNLYEVSPCVFPAYNQTTINARKKDLERSKMSSKKTAANDPKLKARQQALLEKIKKIKASSSK